MNKIDDLSVLMEFPKIIIKMKILIIIIAADIVCWKIIYTMYRSFKPHSIKYIILIPTYKEDVTIIILILQISQQPETCELRKQWGFKALSLPFRQDPQGHTCDQTKLHLLTCGREGIAHHREPWGVSECVGKDFL